MRPDESSRNGKASQDARTRYHLNAMTKTLNGSIIAVLTPKMQSWILERLGDDIDNLSQALDSMMPQARRSTYGQSYETDLEEYKTLHRNVIHAQRHQQQ